METVTITDLPGVVDMLYRAGLSLLWIESRNPDDVVGQLTTLSSSGYFLFAVGSGRPTPRGTGSLPPGFQFQNWTDIPEWPMLTWSTRTLGIVSGFPVEDESNTSLYMDILSGYLTASASTSLCLVVTAEHVSGIYARMGPVLHLMPPTQGEREVLLTDLAAKNRFEAAWIVETAQALSGLEAQEIRQIALVQLLRLGHYDPALASLEKARRLVQGGFLEAIAPADTKVGGLNGLKTWLESRAYAVKRGLPMPKGIVLIGPPGTGKSLSAQLVAQSFNLPLVRLDVGRLMGSFVGESERNLRFALGQVESLSPCVVWIDEIEKALSGSGTNGSEISRRMLQSMLTWMQEQRGAFVFATANDISSMPPELLRKGRFDEIFYVDLPTAQERNDIWIAGLARVGLDCTDYDIAALSAMTEGYTGAEITAAVTDALYESPETPSQADLEQAVRSTKPLSVLAPEQITAIRSWGATHARPASVPTTRDVSPTPRLQG